MLFTLLVRSADGNECILPNMKDPRRIKKGPVMIPCACTNVGCEGETLNDAGFHALYTDGNAHAYYPREGGGDTIFVMNDTGATVATYRL